MDSLKIIPYSYVATEPRKSGRLPSSIHKQPGSNQSEHEQRQSDTSMLRGNLPKLSTGEEVDESPKASRILCSAAPEVTRPDGNHSNTACEPAILRNSRVEPIVATSCQTVCSGGSADYDIICQHAGLSQAQLAGHFVPDADNLDDDIDSLFGDISYIFDEQDNGVTIEDHQVDQSDAYLQHGEDPPHSCSHLPVAEEYPEDEVCSVSRQGVKRQADSAQKKDQILYSTSPNNVEGETSDETDAESVFDNRLYKKRRYSSSLSSRNSSNLFTNSVSPCSQLDNDPFFDRPCQGTMIERGHDDNPIVVGDFSDEYTGNESETDDCDVDKDSDDELCHSPSRYRFVSGSAKRKRDSVTRDYARPLYVAEVLDVNRGREFDDILGQEHIDGELYYLVRWVPTLVPSRVVRRSKAKTLISRFEARCQMPSDMKHR